MTEGRQLSTLIMAYIGFKNAVCSEERIGYVPMHEGYYIRNR